MNGNSEGVHWFVAYLNLAFDGNKYTVTDWFIEMDLFT